jgi:PAS domain S-box-containing protein
MSKYSNTLGANLQEELRDILQAVDYSSIIAITNSKGVITFVNDRFCEISQYGREELIGRDHRILKSGHHPERFYTELWDTISSGKIWTGEIKNRAKDGSFYWVFTTIAPSYQKDGGEVQYVSIRFNITGKKILEEKMNKLKIDLDQAVIEREIREQFLSSLSHDLKTPLTIAKISAQIIEKQPTTDDIKKLSMKITDNINRVDDLITDLLDANRSKTHQNFPLTFAEFNMRDLVSETLENLATIHGDRFVLEADGEFTGHWCLLGIKRILENLATNAIKYGDTQSPVVIKMIDNDNHIVLSVHNLGNPIPEMDQRIIFDYLQRTSSAELSAQNGWGLGLTIVKGLTEAHGGSVRVFSFAGEEGTTFKVTLPKDSRPFVQEKSKNTNLIIVNESENFLRLFRHMPEVVVILSGPQHVFEFVNDAYMETFGFNPLGMSVRELGPSRQNYVSIFDEVFATGIPHKIMKNPIIIFGVTRYFDQTFVPRKNNAGNIIGLLTISSEVTSKS